VTAFLLRQSWRSFASAVHREAAIIVQTVTYAGNLTVDNNARLGVGGTITNNGSVNLNAAANASEFYLNGGTITLNGTGSIIMNMTGAGGTAYIDGSGTLVNNILTQGAGNIGANVLAIINNSTITAINGTQGLTLDPVNGCRGIHEQRHAAGQRRNPRPYGERKTVTSSTLPGELSLDRPMCNS